MIRSLPNIIKQFIFFPVLLGNHWQSKRKQSLFSLSIEEKITGIKRNGIIE